MRRQSFIEAKRDGHRGMRHSSSPEALTFTRDILLFGARAGSDATNINVSGLTADNDFSSPDGLWFSEATRICWIETDDGAYTDVTNCMLLAALPGQVGDGGVKTITGTDQNGTTKQVQTFVGAVPGARLKRFLVGPKECEITGLAETPDSGRCSSTSSTRARRLHPTSRPRRLEATGPMAARRVRVRQRLSSRRTTAA